MTFHDYLFGTKRRSVNENAFGVAYDRGYTEDGSLIDISHISAYSYEPRRSVDESVFGMVRNRGVSGGLGIFDVGRISPRRRPTLRYKQDPRYREYMARQAIRWLLNITTKDLFDTMFIKTKYPLLFEEEFARKEVQQKLHLSDTALARYTELIIESFDAKLVAGLKADYEKALKCDADVELANRQLRKDHFMFGYDPLTTLDKDEDYIKVDANYSFTLAYAFLNDSVYRYLKNKLLERASFDVLSELSRVPPVPNNVEAEQSEELASMIDRYMN